MKIAPISIPPIQLGGFGSKPLTPKASASAPEEASIEPNTSAPAKATFAPSPLSKSGKAGAVRPAQLSKSASAPAFSSQSPKSGLPASAPAFSSQSPKSGLPMPMGKGMGKGHGQSSSQVEPCPPPTQQLSKSGLPLPLPRPGEQGKAAQPVYSKVGKGPPKSATLAGEANGSEEQNPNVASAPWRAVTPKGAALPGPKRAALPGPKGAPLPVAKGAALPDRGKGKQGFMPEVQADVDMRVPMSPPGDIRVPSSPPWKRNSDNDKDLNSSRGDDEDTTQESSASKRRSGWDVSAGPSSAPEDDDSAIPEGVRPKGMGSMTQSNNFEGVRPKGLGGAAGGKAGGKGGAFAGVSGKGGGGGAPWRPQMRPPPMQKAWD